MSRKAELDLDIEDAVFENDGERQELQAQRAELSPRRAARFLVDGQGRPVDEGRGDERAIMALPFYDEISPSQALTELFDGFRVYQPDAEESGASADDRDSRTDDAENPSIGLAQFNRLRRCIGASKISDDQWRRALDELAMAATESRVRKDDFKALFGPAPFFGSENVKDIVTSVLSAERHIHFAKLLVGRFGKPSSEDESSAVVNNMVGLEELRVIQDACFVDPPFNEAAWVELKKKLRVPANRSCLNWMEFSEAFWVSVNNKKVFGDCKDPAAVIYAVLANERVMKSIQESGHQSVNRSAVTNLIKLKREKVDDETWMSLLQDVQTKYQSPKDGAADGVSDGDADDSGESAKVPLVVVRNTRNHVLSYEITYEAQDEVGFTLQSDFYGHCLTVGSIDNSVNKHAIMKELDIITAVNEESLLHETTVADELEEKDRVVRGTRLLRSGTRRVVTFQRQESHFQYNNEGETLHVTLKVMEDLSSDCKLSIKSPPGVSWAPKEYSAGEEAFCLEVAVTKPGSDDPEAEYARVVWDPTTKLIEISLNEDVDANTMLAIEVSGIVCGGKRLVGPCDIREKPVDDVKRKKGDSAVHQVTLQMDWKNRVSRLGRNPVSARMRRGVEHYDTSLEPIACYFSGNSGIELVGDFFGQCAVVKKAGARDSGVCEHDILYSITQVKGNELDIYKCILPHATNQSGKNSHLAEVTKRLKACNKQNQRYRLEFLRLNSHFYHENGRTILTLRALTTLKGGSAFVVKMPSTMWQVGGPLTASVLEPRGINVREVFWDSQHQTVHLTLDDCAVAEMTQVVVDILGVSASDEGKTLCAGPGEVAGVQVGDAVSPSEMVFQIHDHWNFDVHETFDASKVKDNLKRFALPPAKLWDVMEYTSLLFDMFTSENATHISSVNMNRLVSIVCGDEKKLQPDQWITLCKKMEADSEIGLSRHQFGCCWYNVVGLNSHEAEKTYLRLHTAKRVFDELGNIYQDGGRKDILLESTIQLRLAKFLGFSAQKKKSAIDDLMRKGLKGWDCDTLSQIVCGHHPIVKIEEKDVMDLWVKLHYSKKLFNAYNSKGGLMRKKNLSDLMDDARIKTPKFSADLWTKICNSVRVDDNGGLRLGDFLDVYAGDLIGSRHAVGDWYRIETFKMLPERRVKDEVSKEAVMSVAPEKVNVEDIAAKFLEDMTSTEELFQDLLDKGIEFSKLAKIEEVDRINEFEFKTDLHAKKKSRKTGFLTIQIESITELRDQIVQRDSSFNSGGVAEELYVMLEITTAAGLKPRLPKHPKRGKFTRIMEKLFGEKNLANEYQVREDEMWNGDTQLLMRRMSKAEEILKSANQQSPEFAAAVAELHDLERTLMPKVRKVERGVAPEWRIFSSSILRNPSPDAVIRFSNDQFRLFVPEHEHDEQLYVVCKLFKRIGSGVSAAELRVDDAEEALKKTQDTVTILRDLVKHQQEHLRHVIAAQNLDTKKAAEDMNSEVWKNVAKLKQLRLDVEEFEIELEAREKAKIKADGELDAAKQTRDDAQKEHEDKLLAGIADHHAAEAPVNADAGEPLQKRMSQRRSSILGFAASDLPTVDATAASTKQEKAKRPSMRRPSLLGVNSDKQKTEKSVPELQQVKFIGQAFFDLGALLNVLHDENEKTDDLAVFHTETHNDVGVVLLSFEYKCASLQEQSVADKLAHMTINMAADDVTEKDINEDAFLYPSHAHLEVKWTAGLLQVNDRICLVREGLKHSIGMPYAFVLWAAFDKKTNAVKFKNDGVGSSDEKTGELEPEINDWWIPDSLRNLYSSSRETLVETDPSKTRGSVHFPSAIDLSLPPGIYRLYLLRNETDLTGNNFRIKLGMSSALAVLPGINGAHTSFGTTPLVDVKPMSASLQVFTEQHRHVVANSLAERDGFRDETYLTRISKEQELKVIRRDIKTRMEERKLDEELGRDTKSLSEIIVQLEDRVGNLTKELDSLNAVVSTNQVAADTSPDPTRAVISTTEQVIFSYRFVNGDTVPGDRIVVLPADVVRVSDHLRATILGKLQANDAEQVKKVREALEKELQEVEAFFNARMSFSSMKKVAWRYIKPYVDALKGNAGATDQSDTYNSATGATDSSFVWEECLEHYQSASSATKKCFAYIIRDLLDEVSARKAVLGLKGVAVDSSKSRLGKATALLKCGIEISVPSNATYSEDENKRRIAMGEVSTTFGNRFAKGGYFVAKYVRRVSSNADGGVGDPNSSAGEICRYGPFFVERAMLSYSPVQVALILARWIAKAAMSEYGKLTIKVVFQAYLSFLKYFLAVVSLSFNINVLAGNFKIDATHLKELLHSFKAKLLTYYGPFQIVLTTIYEFFSGYIQDLLEKLDLFAVAGECFTGFFLFPVLAMLFSATFVVYIVVQEDLLLKVQKLPSYLSFNPGKTVLGFFEQLGALLVIPLYLTIKSCVLFISGNWGDFYYKLHDDPSKTLERLSLFRTATPACPNVSLAKINYGFGIAALVLIIFFLFVCLPLLLLDLFSWVPLTELEKPEKLKLLAASHKRLDIKAAVHSNASLVEFHPIRYVREKTASCTSRLKECCRCCSDTRAAPCSSRLGCCVRNGPRYPMFAGFAQHYSDYMGMTARDLRKKYGLFGSVVMFVNIYAHLMLQSIGRALGVFLGWRLRAEHMYPNPLMKSNSRWKIFDAFCLRFNFAWKVQYIKDKMIMPFVNVCVVTFGLWGESQWKEFNVEERANDCYRMEPSGEVKQLQMMTLQGKIISLFWLCIPETMVLAYLAEVLNRGPMFSYFLNNQFLQADIPESEREKDPVWRFHYKLAFKGEEDVVYLSDTRFYSTLLKWGSAMVEIVSLLMVYAPSSSNRTLLFGITLISAVVTPLLEFNQQLIQAYVDYVETAENLAASSGLVDKLEKLEKARKAADQTKENIGDLPDVDVSMSAVLAWIRGKKQARQRKADQTAASAAGAGKGVNPAAGTVAPVLDENAIVTTDGVVLSPPSTVGRAGVATPSGSVGVAMTAVAGAGLASQLSGSNGAVVQVGSVLGSGGPNQRNNFDDSDDDDSDDEKEDERGEDEEKEDDGDDNDEQKGGDEAALASLVAATGLVKTTKELIQLNAMPQISYVVLTDALGAGEGELTISWQVNARQRFHALDAIGMFPKRAKGDTTFRSVQDCICYRLLKHKSVEPFGWSQKRESEDGERELIKLQAQSLRDLSMQKVSKMAKESDVGIHEDETDPAVQARIGKHKEKLELAGSTMQSMLESPKLKPYKKKLPDILEEDIIESRIHEKYPRTSRAYSQAAATKEEAAKRTRKVVSGQVKFRPANNCVKPGVAGFEMFIYGNDAGIYQSKYGLHDYEFCYLRCIDDEAKVVGVGESKEDVKEKGADGGKNQKVVPKAAVGPRYEILDRFVSNAIQIGTFNLFMSLTCDQPLVGSKEKLNLSWIIYGVGHRVLSDSKIRNCIGFYKVDGSKGGTCTRIEIIPPSAYLEAEKGRPCPGRMAVTTPSEPGVYEIRFLFNFFKQAKLHRQCQVFGDLEDEMQQLRIQSFYEKRAVTEELRKFGLREPRAFGIARMNTHAWLSSMLLSTIRDPVEKSKMESTTEYSEHLLGRLKSKLQHGLESSSRMFQQRIAKILMPLRMNSFFDVLLVALQSNTQLSDQLASVTFISPTEEDEKRRGLNRERDMLLLPPDKDLYLMGSVSFRPLAINYLQQRSLCGYHDFVDDDLLNNGQIMQTLNQIMSNLSSGAVTLYESAIAEAIKDLKVEADKSNLTNALQGVDAMLMDVCRNHIQSMIRALLETDCRTGKRWPGIPAGSYEKLSALRAGTSLQPDASDELEVVVEKLDAAAEVPGGAAPVTRQYIALRKWIRPKLERKIVTIMKQRRARMMDGNMPILMQLVASCSRPGLSLAGNPFPSHRATKTDSPVYFLEEKRQKKAETSDVFDGDSQAAAKIGVDNQSEEEKAEANRQEDDGRQDRNNADDDDPKGFDGDNVQNDDIDDNNGVN